MAIKQEIIRLKEIQRWLNHKGFNDNEEEMNRLSRLSRGLMPPQLLPFHNWGKSKYHALRREYPAEDLPLMDRESLAALQKYLRKEYYDEKILQFNFTERSSFCIDFMLYKQSVFPRVSAGSRKSRKSKAFKYDES